MARATTPRGAVIVIATTTTAITVGSAFLMTIVDQEYPSVGSGLWWAVQTVTTVGYGDHTPVTDSGRLVAAFVMLVGIGFLTVITAAITSTFVSRTTTPTSPVERRGDNRATAQ